MGVARTIRRFMCASEAARKRRERLEPVERAGVAER